MHLPWTAAMFTGAVYSVAWYKVLLLFEPANNPPPSSHPQEYACCFLSFPGSCCPTFKWLKGKGTRMRLVAGMALGERLGG